jgi:hypothetical protein
MLPGQLNINLRYLSEQWRIHTVPLFSLKYYKSARLISKPMNSLCLYFVSIHMWGKYVTSFSTFSTITLQVWPWLPSYPVSKIRHHRSQLVLQLFYTDLFLLCVVYLYISCLIYGLVYSIFNTNNNYHYITTSFTRQPCATFACFHSGWFIHKCKWPYLEWNVLIFAQMAHGRSGKNKLLFHTLKLLHQHTPTAAATHTVTFWLLRFTCNINPSMQLQCMAWIYNSAADLGALYSQLGMHFRALHT